MLNDELSKLIKELLALAPIMHYSIIRPIETDTSFNLTPLQMQTLLMLYLKDTLNMTTLASELMISKQQLTKIIDVLVRSAYVERYQDSQNRRSIFIRLSTKGQEMIRQIQDKIIQDQLSTFQELSEEERIDLLKAIDTIKKLLVKEATKEAFHYEDWC